MKFLSVCSGIEAASVAWEPLGWKPLAFSEIEAFPRAVLAHRYPEVPVHGDFTVLRDQDWIVDADLLVGGTPCQAFSVAGKRQSLADDRGNLSLEFVRLADAIDNLRSSRGQPGSIIVWENVPGVLSVKDNAFGCFIAALAGDASPYIPPRGKWTNAGLVIGPERTVAWRILDAQYFGVAQRRRRVFVVASARDGFDPAEVLFEREGVRRDSPPRREAGQEVTGTLEASIGTSRGAGTPTSILSHWDGDQFPHPTLNQSHNTGGVGQSNQELFSKRGAYLAPSHIALTGDVSHCLNAGGMGRQDYETETLIAFNSRQDPDHWIDRTGPIDTHGSTQAIAFSSKDYGADATNDLAPTLRAMPHQGSYANGGGQMAVAQSMSVRRLTPRECERLQGFPDDYTLIEVRGKPAADGPRYKALGNSMAVPVMAWIGKRISQHIQRE